MFSLRATRQPTLFNSISSSTPSTIRLVVGRRFYSDYGSGEANPNTPNPSVDKEHPGPPPPSTADKGKNAQPQQSSGQSSGASQQQQSDASKKSASDAQPKLNTSTAPPSEESEEVAKHNREMENRADKQHGKVRNEDAEKDKVHKGFWSGASSHGVTG